MSHLGFIVPVDMESSDSVIVCPSADPNGLINSCLHLWDSLAGMISLLHSTELLDGVEAYNY